MQRNNLNPSRMIGRLVLSSAIAIATLGSPTIAMAQNQSDVTGPNMSDNTGSNMSDNTGTIVGGARIFADINGNAATLGESLESFFGQFGDDLGIASTLELSAKVSQAQAECPTQPNEGTRRFALTSRTPQVNQACEEFNQLIQSIHENLDNMSANVVQRRLW